MFDSTAVTCPWCWSPVELGVDLYPGAQEYVEDCSVCCHPMRVRVEVDADGELVSIEADREGD
ncbi:MAG: CPXCG motif-containing cysteine-rich protein [Planctomycetes bacterium]|nr:CPXCG motif-containing cysteine-rich protein [Planctomycetota bacterium]